MKRPKPNKNRVQLWCAESKMGNMQLVIFYPEKSKVWKCAEALNLPFNFNSYYSPAWEPQTLLIKDFLKVARKVGWKTHFLGNL